MMVFRNGGRIRRKDRLAYDEQQLKVVKCYKYLGITIRSSVIAFTMPIKEETLTTVRAMADILSLSCHWKQQLNYSLSE
jgi:hypothetical protein